MRLKIADVMLKHGVTDPKVALFVIELLRDFDYQRAAVASGHQPMQWSDLYNMPAVQAAITSILQELLDGAVYDHAWLKQQLVENHYLARQQRKISASNQALTLLGKLNDMNSFSPERVEVATVTETVDRLMRHKQRMLNEPKPEVKVDNNDDLLRPMSSVSDSDNYRPIAPEFD